MATVEQVLAAMEHVRSCTGDAMAGLTPADLVDLSLAMPGGGIPEHLDVLLAKIHRAFPTLFDPRTGTPITPRTPSPADPRRQEGATADTGREHEDGLARQATAAARLDLLVIAAVRGAHRKAEGSAGVLEALQREIDDAVRGRTDLDTPAGARDFQRFLIGKLGEIEAVLRQADLDEASYRALMTAWKSLYATGRDPGEPAAPGDDRPVTPAGSGPAPAESDVVAPDGLEDLDFPDVLDVLDDPDDYAAPTPVPPAPPPPPVTAPPAPAPPMAAAPSGFGTPLGAGLPLGDLLSGTGAQDTPRRTAGDAEVDDAFPLDDDPEDDLDEARDGPDDDRPDEERPDDAQDDTADTPTASGPTTVTLPTGDTVTAASPQLAAVITEAAAGTPIPDAFAHQGITLPPTGTAVPDPLDPARLAPGDVGMFTDRYALSLGDAKAIVNGQIQQSTSVAGPSFLGWEHPPGPGVTPTVPPPADAPTPTRPATTGG